VIAAFAGIDYWHLTLRELLTAANKKVEYDNARFAAMMGGTVRGSITN